MSQSGSQTPKTILGFPLSEVQAVSDGYSTRSLRTDSSTVTHYPYDVQLFIAAKTDDISFLNRYYTHFIRPCLNAFGHNPLHVAIQSNSMKAARYFLSEKHFYIADKTKYGITAKELAFAYQRTGLMERIMQSDHFALEKSFRNFISKYSDPEKFKNRASLSVAESAALGIDVYYKYKPLFDECTQYDEPERPIDADLGGGVSGKNYKPITENIKKQGAAYETQEADFCNYSCVTPEDRNIFTIENYLCDRAILTKSTLHWYGFNRGETPDDGIYFGNGSNELFNAAVSWITQDSDKIIVGKDVVLYQVPCYAYFADSAVYNQCDVETIPMLEENGFKLTPDQLRTKITDVNQRLFIQHIEETLERYPAYFRKLKTLGIAVEKLPKAMAYTPELSAEEFDAYRNQLLAAIQEQCLDPQQRQKIPEPPRPARVSTLAFNNPHSPLGTYYTQMDINELEVVRSQFGLWVIEDRANEELNVVPVKPLGSFGNASVKGYPKRLFILLTPSKTMCLADLRLGVIVAFTKEASVLSPGRLPLFRAMNLQVGTIGDFKTSLLRTAFYDCEERAGFIKELTQEYAWRQDLVFQLLEGSKALGTEEKDHKPNEYEAYIQQQVQDPAVIKMLAKGLPDFKCVRKPEFAFQLLFDLTAYKGKWFGLRQLNSPLDFRMAIFKQANICTISEVLYPEKTFIRFSLGIDRKAIVLAFIKLHVFFAMLQPKPLPELVHCYEELDALQAQDTCDQSAKTTTSLSSSQILDRLSSEGISKPSLETKEEKRTVTDASTTTTGVMAFPPVFKLPTVSEREKQKSQIESQIADYILPMFHVYVPKFSG